jgi:Protein of unknown function (DUF2950)
LKQEHGKRHNWARRDLLGKARLFQLKGQTDKAPGGAKEYLVDEKMVGGFAFVAYPAEYPNSGIMTFIINQDGVLLQKDLGKTTTETATAMSEFDPDSSWVIVEE